MTALTITPADVSCDQDRGAWVDCSQTAGVALTIGDIVYLDASNVLRKATALTVAGSKVYGMVVGGVNDQYGDTAIAVGDQPAICVAGNVMLGTPLIGSTAPASGQFFWLSKTTPGGLEDTAPTGAYQVIVARSEGSGGQIYIMPGISSPVSA